MIIGELALRHTSGSLLKVIFSWITSIRVSFLQLGQKRGNFNKTVSEYTFVLVRLSQIGQGIHSPLSRSLLIVPRFLMAALRLCVWLLPFYYYKL